MQQRALDNAYVLWQRFVEKNRRTVEEHAEQLKSLANLSALVAGFSVIGFLEFGFEPEDHPRVVVILFGFFTALTVVLMVNCFVACSLILASILKTGKRYVSEEEEADFIWRCRAFNLNYVPGSRPPMPHRTFEQHWQHRCEGEWRRSFTLFTLGVPSFLAQLTLAAWIKFDTSLPTAALMTAVIIAAIPYWVLVQKRWADHLLSRDSSFKGPTGEPPAMGLPFDFHRAPDPFGLSLEASMATRDSGAEEPALRRTGGAGDSLQGGGPAYGAPAVEPDHGSGTSAQAGGLHCGRRRDWAALDSSRSWTRPGSGHGLGAQTAGHTSEEPDGPPADVEAGRACP
mmetsp:Transcript_17447/g.41722  ORF Transcript_17447/g.41722 Transcript_17447/m.41722 type:complete len:342 (-) Transcript_17447:138-1163(-)